MKHSPCKNCPDRRHLCWDECVKYKTWRAEHQAASNAEYQYKKAWNDWQSVFYIPKEKKKKER